MKVGHINSLFEYLYYVYFFRINCVVSSDEKSTSNPDAKSSAK